jgi:diguanylate cyclase
LRFHFIDYYHANACFWQLECIDEVAFLLLLCYNLVVNLLRKTGPRNPYAAREYYRRLTPDERIAQLVAKDAAIRALEIREARARDESSHDALTGLLNRRGIEDTYRQAMAARRRRQDGDKPDLLALIDLDRFKQINDTGGHAAGDAALIRVGEVLQTSVRGGDVIGRLGGDEFVALLFGATVQEGMEATERMRRNLALSYEQDRQTVVPTFSMGLAEIGLGLPLEEVSDRADVALYQAKEGGRDRVIVASAPPVPSS